MLIDTLWVLAFPLWALTIAITLIVNDKVLTTTYTITVGVVLLTLFIGLNHLINA